MGEPINIFTVWTFIVIRYDLLVTLDVLLSIHVIRVMAMPLEHLPGLGPDYICNICNDHATRTLAQPGT